MSQPPVYELDKVHFAYPQHTALSDLTFRIECGQSIALLGANGSGKSTLLRLLDGLYFAQSGSIHAFGQALTQAQFADEDFNLAFRRRVGLVFQNPDVQLFCPSVWDEVAFGPLQLGWHHDKIRTEVDAMLNFMQLDHLRKRPPHRLSGGEKKRVAIASVLIAKPKVLLLDEPTAGLDPESQAQIMTLLSQLKHEDRTLITATHDLAGIKYMANDAYVLAHGRLLGKGCAKDILADTQLLAQSRLRGHDPQSSSS